MIRFLLYAVPLVVTLYGLIDCILIPGALARALPKWLWLVVIVLIPFFGALAWLFAGRPKSEPDTTGVAGPIARVTRRSGGRTAAPDDDAAFLRKLADDEWSRKMRDRRSGAAPDTDEHDPDVP